MWRQEQDSLYKEVADELTRTESGALIARRLGGLCTLLALSAWLGGGWWAAQYACKGILMLNTGLMLGQSYYAPMENNSSTPQATTDEDADLRDAPRYLEISEQERKRILKEWEDNRRTELKIREQEQRSLDQKKESVEQLSLRIDHYRYVQGGVMIGWSILLTLAAGAMLGAALTGLMGGATTRRWHRLAAGWITLSTLGTLGGLWLLTSFGGFPKPDYGVVAAVAGVQISYAFIVVVVLALSRRTEMDWLTKLS